MWISLQTKNPNPVRHTAVIYDMTKPSKILTDFQQDIKTSSYVAAKSLLSSCSCQNMIIFMGFYFYLYIMDHKSEEMT